MAKRRKTGTPGAFVLAMDMADFSALLPEDHDKVVSDLYGEIARIITSAGGSLDRKTIGDGAIFYFTAAIGAIESAIHIHLLFKEERFWSQYKFNVRLACRIALHFGQFFWMRDSIEERDALFGRNIITVARLEPVVRNNEIWCTQHFKTEAQLARIRQDVIFHPLGKCRLAKAWSEELVFALYLDQKETPPATLVQDDVPRTIQYRSDAKAFPHTYYVLIRLKHPSDGAEHLMAVLKPIVEFRIEAIYYVFGPFDVLLRLGSREPLTEVAFSDFLAKSKITWPENRCDVTEVHCDAAIGGEAIVSVPINGTRYLKAFTYIKSMRIVTDNENISDVVKIAQDALHESDSVATYYRNRSSLILPIVVPIEKYYALARAIERIERLAEARHWEDVIITTYLAHDFQEWFETIIGR